MVSRRPAPAGMTLVECLVALVLASLVSAAVVSVLATQGRLLRAVTARTADSDALRIAAGVLAEELRWVDASRDLHALGADSLALRAFRGGGRVCSIAADLVSIDYTGARRPAAGKDSVLLHTGRAEHVRAVRGVADAPCGAGTGVQLRLDAPVPGAAYALVFESGSYFLRDRAFRYRLGGEGRQPLTDERFAASGSTVRLRADSAAALVHLRWPAPRAAETLRIHLLTTQP